jgi:hypothetical protein
VARDRDIEKLYSEFLDELDGHLRNEAGEPDRTIVGRVLHATIKFKAAQRIAIRAKRDD